MNLNSLKPAAGSTKKTKRIGRGQGSGHGGTATKGHKGDKSRSGSKYKRGFEGGQMPLKQRVPKFGFKNLNRVEYQGLNLDTLQTLVDSFNVTTVDLATLKAHGLISGKKPVKILGRGEVTAALTIKAHAFSKTAIQGIESKGGVAEKIEK
jgi:large subunit ribosomal protein L15